MKILARIITKLTPTLLKRDLGLSPNPVHHFPHLSLQESFRDLVVSIMDMPGSAGASHLTAPGMSHEFIPARVQGPAVVSLTSKKAPEFHHFHRKKSDKVKGIGI